MEDLIRPEELHLSTSMEYAYRQLVRYAELTSFSFGEEREKLLSEGFLPCRDKREGKRAYEKIREDVIDPGRLRKNCGTDHRPAPTIPADRKRTVYLCDNAAEDPLAKQIAEQVSGNGRARIVRIHHYKDVFDDSAQGFLQGKQSRSLILAKNEGTLIYPGAPVCQDFGFQHFYYTSCVMNCVYDCEYCYLQGMYPSGILTVFVNQEDVFREVEKLLSVHPVYLSVSYDTDLLALEGLTGFVSRWIAFTREHEDLTIEIRTKCAGADLFERTEPCGRVIFAYTISPEEVVRTYEHGTPSLDARLQAARKALDSGWPVRLCFDPLVLIPDGENIYRSLIRKTAKKIPLSKVRDVSVGTFRISASYLKRIRRVRPDSPLIQFPFDQTKGYSHYPGKILETLEGAVIDELKKEIPEEKIFRWEKQGLTR